MGIIRLLVIAVLTVSALTFFALFGNLPRFRKTPIGMINRLIWIHIPGTFIAIDSVLTGGRGTVFLKRSGNYMMNENHPLVLIFYLSLIIGGEILAVPRLWEHLSATQQSTLALLMIFPYAFTYLTVTSTGSVITRHNHNEEMHRYPYDHVIFYPGAFCRTCLHVKPARSKHCRLCNVCVSKMDHHCPWVMTCLGRDNYRWFLLMLLSLGLLLLYGAQLGYSVLSDYLQRRFERENPTLRSSAGVAVAWTTGLGLYDRLNAFGWAFIWDIRIGTITLLAAFTAPLALGLLTYHLYLIWAGVTTNENFKWDDWKEDVRDGYVYLLSTGKRPPPDGQSEPVVRWPGVERRQVLLNRAIPVSRNRFPQDLVPREPEWSRVESMRVVDNLYDLGFVANLKDCF